MNINLINKKLDQLESYLKELEEIVLIHSQKEIKQENALMRVAERLVQLLVDTMIDINVHILISKNKTYDETRSTFLLLGEMGILPKEFSEKIAPIAGLRNILVHRYETLDKNIFIKNLLKNKDDFKRYIVAIHELIAGKKSQ